MNVTDCWFGSDRFTSPDGLSGKVNLVNWYSLDLVDYTNGDDLKSMENLSIAFGSQKTFDLVFVSNEGKMSNVSNHLKFTALSYDEDNEYVEYGSSTLKYDGQSIKVIYIPKEGTKGEIELEIYGVKFKYNVNHTGGNTFSDLSKLCKGSEINNVRLTQDYKYNSVSDTSLGISITDKNLTIDADGHTIDGAGVSALFQLGIGSNLTIMNANIVDCKKCFSNFGQITLINTTIENSKNSFVNYGNITLINSTVINDTGTLFNSKSVITFKAGNINLINSTFIDIKRAIYEDKTTSNKEKGKAVIDIENCTFQNIKELIFRAKSANIHNSEFNNISKVNVYYGLDVTNNIFSNSNIDSSFFKSTYNPINISNNWYGNTINNYGEKLVKSGDVNNWIILNAEYNDDETGIIVKLDEIYDAASKKIESADGLNTLLNVSINNQSKQVIYLENGEAAIKLEDISQNKHVLLIQYLSNEYTLELNKKTGSLSDLKNLIEKSTGAVILSKNYTYNESSDSGLTEGIIIDKSLTVDGNGFTMDCGGKTRAFIINADNTTIQNLKIINGHHDEKGGAIYWNASNGRINNSILENNTALKGGAIYQEKVLRISNSQFNNIKANDAGTVYRNAELITDNVTFTNNTPQDFEYLGGTDDDDSTNDEQDTNTNTIKKQARQPVANTQKHSTNSIPKIITKNKEITVYNYQLLLATLNSIFNMDFTNGHILVYIDGKLVFNGTTTDDLSLLIYDLIQLISGDHQIKVEFTDNKGNSKTYEENITFVE